jgi:hypothetical protein
MKQNRCKKSLKNIELLQRKHSEKNESKDSKQKKHEHRKLPSRYKFEHIFKNGDNIVMVIA